MKSRNCVGRIQRNGVSFPCPVGAVKVGRDGLWRCIQHNAEKYPGRAEREALQDESDAA